MTRSLQKEIWEICPQRVDIYICVYVKQIVML